MSCIVKPVPDAAADLPNQLFIDPDGCIDCGACEPECPWEAIFEDEHVPPELLDDIALNARVVKQRALFAVPDEDAAGSRPTPEQVSENRRRWGVVI
ncbi:4Fe-4S binding protein [Micromonospora sp. C95]|uniref:4Fe-4S binding protein n=1 Tax=Micromonospora sp. C95 TaxID=2824882 RepID=UPI0027DC2309|nr:4Fe-4S binding protein [Micromonospora sp. C95]